MNHKKIKVLFLMEYLNLGGIERLMVQFAERAPVEWGELFFCAYEMERATGMALEIEAARRQVFCYKKKGGYDFEFLFFLADLVKKHEITHVHTQDFGPIEYSVALKLLRPSIKLIHTQHTLINLLRERKYRWFFQFASYFYQRIIAVSDHVATQLRRRCPFTNGNISVVWNGIDESFFSTESTLNPSEKLRLINVARISPEKNLISLLKLCRLLKARGVPFVFHHIGGGKEKNELVVKSFVRENNLSEEVIFHGVQKDIRPLMKEADIFITASHTEGHPVAVLEALASAKTCLCSDIEPHRQVSAPGVFFFPADDQERMLELLLDIRAHREKYERLRMTGPQFINASFTLDKMLTQYFTIYQQGKL